MLVNRWGPASSAIKAASLQGTGGVAFGLLEGTRRESQIPPPPPTLIEYLCTTVDPLYTNRVAMKSVLEAVSLDATLKPICERLWANWSWMEPPFISPSRCSPT